MGQNGIALPTKRDFAQQVAKSFRVSPAEASAFDLALVEVNEIADDESQETFSLLFQAPADAPAVQMTYEVENADLGKMHIFLVPVKKNHNGLYFEAIFNQLKRSEQV